MAKSLKPDELFIKIVKDELITLLGGDYIPLETSKKPTIVMLRPKPRIFFIAFEMRSPMYSNIKHSPY